MTLTAVAFLNGLSDTCIVLLGIFYFFKFLIDYGKHKKKLTPFLALLALSLGLMHLGGAVAFIMKVFWQQDIPINLFGFLSYVHIPFGLSLAIYLGFDVFTPKLKWWVVGIHILMGIVLITALIVSPDIQLDTRLEPTTINELRDINIKHIVGTINTGFLISAVLSLGYNFLRIRTKMKDDEKILKKKSLLLGIGWMVWGVAEFLCTFNFVKITIIPNSIIFGALIIIFLGFAPLKDDK